MKQREEKGCRMEATLVVYHSSTSQGNKGLLGKQKGEWYSFMRKSTRTRSYKFETFTSYYINPDLVADDYRLKGWTWGCLSRSGRISCCVKFKIPFHVLTVVRSSTKICSFIESLTQSGKSSSLPSCKTSATIAISFWISGS